MMIDEQPSWPWLSRTEAHPELAGLRPVIADEGMVSSPSAVASVIGANVLKAGGNAVDAAIACSAALAVTVPMQCGPGGDAFWLIREANGDMLGLDASGRSSRRANAAELTKQGLKSVPPRSAYAVTVPGAIDGWASAHKRYGRLPFKDLLAQAASLAEGGFFASRHVVAGFKIAQKDLSANGALSIFGLENRGPHLYEPIRQQPLARTLREIGETGGKGFYEGPIAAAIAQAVKGGGGWVGEDDLAAHSSEWVKPLEAPFRDLVFHVLPPPSQGSALLAALRAVEMASPRPLDRYKASDTHLLVEAVAAAMALRDELNGDQPSEAFGDFNTFAAAFVQAFDPARKSETASRRTGHHTRGDTAHLAVVDSRGMAVSLIQSLYFDFGSYVAVPEGGFILQNRGTSFRLQPDLPASLLPNRKPPSTLMPTIATRAGDLALTMGCMGGDGQMQTQLQLIVDMVDGGLDPQQATSRPRWYLDRAPAEGAKLLVEGGVSTDIVNGMRALGHIVEVIGAAEEVMGHAQIISCAKSGALVGAADPRSDGQAVGIWGLKPLEAKPPS